MECSVLHSGRRSSGAGEAGEGALGWCPCQRRRPRVAPRLGSRRSRTSVGEGVEGAQGLPPTGQTNGGGGFTF